MSWISKTLKRQLQKWLPPQTDNKTLATIAALQQRVDLLEKQQAEAAAAAKALEEEAADEDETAGLVKTTEVLSRRLQRLTKVSEARYVELIRLAQAVKWAAIDATDELRWKNFEVTCRICRHSAPRESYATHVTQCKFQGGRLERFECPTCGVIFGPLKVLMLSPAELGHEYTYVYKTYSEGNTTENEIRTFHSLQPRREGTYCNFGAGEHLESIRRLRGEGWNLYAYEPHIDSDEPWVIRDEAVFRQMRFDGIISNNVIEHLPDPVATFRLLASLLKDDRSAMAHSTPCYEYSFEFTRFHLFFYVGQSVEHLCRQTRLELGERFQEGTYIRYVYRPASVATAVSRAA